MAPKKSAEVVVRKVYLNQMLNVSKSTGLVLNVKEEVISVPSLYKFWDTMKEEEGNGTFANFFPTFEIFKSYLETIRKEGVQYLREVFYQFMEWWDTSNDSNDNSIFNNDFDYEDYAEILYKNFDSM